MAQLRRGGGYTHVTQEDPPDGDGWVRLALLYEDEHEARDFLLRFGAQLEVLEPAALREQIIQHAQSIVAFYAQRP